MAEKKGNSEANVVSDEPPGTSDAQPDEELFPGVKDVNTFSQQALKSVLVATRCSNSLPTGDGFDFYSTFHSVRDVLDIQGRQILQLIQRLLKQQNVKAKFSESTDALELEDKFDVLIDANDQLLERVGVCLDEASGLKKPEATLVISSAQQKNIDASWNKKKNHPSSNTFRLLSARNIQRPQFKFQDKVDNSNKPFQQKIESKPNAALPLDESLRIPEGVSFEDLENPEFRYPHPYQYELNHFVPSQDQLADPEVKMYPPLEDTVLTMVETVGDLTKMCQTLKQQKEIAIDLEAHSYRTFQGITCLMQISTREQDYIIDTLTLRSDICMLNDVFTDPNIVKVLHGADSDIVWLQRDFGVYIVNMFDTGQAARLLQHSRFSLAHLLQFYCNITVDKQYQLADWRIRPLPDVLLRYAREDTHYLLYIYDRMRKELIENGNEQKNLLLSVISKSTQICAKVYSKPCFKESDYMDLYRKSKKTFNSQQLQALKNFYSWRDKTARAEDESIGYVLPNHMMLQMSAILPRESQGIIACCNPIPPLVRQYLIELHNIIMQSREAPLTKVQNVPATQPSAYQHPKYAMDSLLNCPHDRSHSQNTKLDMATVLPPDSSLIAKKPSMFASQESIINVKKKPVLTALGWNTKEDGVCLTTAKQIALQLRKSFSSPFEKYLPPDVVSKESTGLQDDKPSLQMDVDHKHLWKLKPNTVKKATKRREEEELDPETGQPQHLFAPPAKKQKVDTFTNPVITKEEEKTQVSLRQQMAPKKKNKKKKQNKDYLYEAEDPTISRIQDEQVALGDSKSDRLETQKKREEADTDNTEKRQKKKKKKKPDLKEFKPYDYSKADTSIFEAGNSKKNVFDPNAKGRKKKQNKSNKVKNPFFRNSKGQKSVTFSSGGRGQGKGQR
ncbi:exosome component 10-like [Gigantopelta aegis]|uniref:exosome component 10-like n=1 Tax=Gigantopelta aegis TaxID=1735272 RepID=UPI001B889F7B|nr:exosome component 10-like [Gigantopelta aegis]